MTDYLVKDSDMAVVADAIRTKGSTSAPLEFPQGMADAVAAIQSGKPEQSKTVTITQNGTTEVLPDEGKALSKVTAVVEVESGGSQDIVLPQLLTFESAFRNAHLPEKTTIIATQTSDYAQARYMLYNSNVFKAKISIDNKNPPPFLRADYFCTNDSILTEIDFSGIIVPIKSLASSFKGATALATIGGPLMFTQDVGLNSSTFSGCKELKNITFGTETVYKSISFTGSPLLSPASVQSIIDGLADLSAGTAQTLTLNAAIQLSEAQRASITAKNWNLVQ